MVAIPGPVEFVMGSPSTAAPREKDEVQHEVRITRTFALAAKSVNVEEYCQFENDYKLPDVYSRLPDLSVVGTSWYQAAAYCNWLSKQEGVPQDQWCYVIEQGKASKLKQNYLALEGYRLPTEAEMEYATRAGALTSRYYGETDELLAKYAWYVTNSEEKTWPVRSKKPNDLGLFDVHGNVWCWCQEAYATYPAANGDEAVEDKEGDSNVISTASRVLRGGSFDNLASVVRSAYRSYVPTSRSDDIGFRSARTSRLDRLTALPLPP